MEFPGLSPQLPPQINMGRQSVSVVKPVEKTEGGRLKSVLERNREPAFNQDKPKGTNDEESARLAAELLAQEVSDSSRFEISWAVNDKTGTLFVEVKDKNTGEVLRQIPPNDILANEGRSDLSGILLDKTA